MADNTPSQQSNISKDEPILSVIQSKLPFCIKFYYNVKYLCGATVLIVGLHDLA